MTLLRDEISIEWFGDQQTIGELPPDRLSIELREIGDSTSADQFTAATNLNQTETFASADVFGKLFTRFIKTTHLCGFVGKGASGNVLPVSRVKPDKSLIGKSLKLTLEGLHVARYPGFGIHRILFDFAVQAQGQKDRNSIFHYNARFEASDGETVPVRNFPLFYGVKPSSEGVTFGFQTVNVSSGFDEGLLDFLKRDEFKKGLNIAGSITPLLGQISEMTATITRWLAGQSKNAKVQEFRQGLDFGSGSLGGGLALGSYIVVQIPLDYQREWDWNRWEIDPTLVRLVQKDSPSEPLSFNHVIFGLHEMN